jgi:hypothetical protein
MIHQNIPGFVALLIPFFLVASQWQAMTLHNDQVVNMWLQNSLSKVPSDAVVITQEDHHTFALWYAQEVAEQRQDIRVVDQRLWNYVPYRRYIAGPDIESIVDLAAVSGKHPLCVVDDERVLCP